MPFYKASLRLRLVVSRPCDRKLRKAGSSTPLRFAQNDSKDGPQWRVCRKATAGPLRLRSGRTFDSAEMRIAFPSLRLRRTRSWGARHRVGDQGSCSPTVLQFLTKRRFFGSTSFRSEGWSTLTFVENPRAGHSPGYATARRLSHFALVPATARSGLHSALAVQVHGVPYGVDSEREGNLNADTGQDAPGGVFFLDNGFGGKVQVAGPVAALGTGRRPGSAGKSIAKQQGLGRFNNMFMKQCGRHGGFLSREELQRQKTALDDEEPERTAHRASVDSQCVAIVEKTASQAQSTNHGHQNETATLQPPSPRHPPRRFW